MAKAKNFFMVSNNIFSLELKPRDFIAYCCLLKHSGNEKKSCFPSRRIIAKECCMDAKTVDTAIKSLSDKGLVKKSMPSPSRRYNDKQSVLSERPVRCRVIIGCGWF